MMEDNETTFPQLYERIAKTLDFLKKVDAGAFEGKEDSEVVLSTGAGDFQFTGRFMTSSLFSVTDKGSGG